MPGRRLPPLHAIRAFEAAARHGSMTGAAGELNVTPGAISRHVRALEALMETPLFLRRATGLELTLAGETLARSVGEALDRIAEAASGARLRRYRPLSIGVYGYFASRFLLPRWQDLMQACPHLEVDLHTSLNPLELLPEHYDAVIAVSDGMPRAGLASHRLLPIATVPVCAMRHAASAPTGFRHRSDVARPAEAGGLATMAEPCGSGHSTGAECGQLREYRADDRGCGRRAWLRYRDRGITWAGTGTARRGHCAPACPADPSAFCPAVRNTPGQRPGAARFYALGVRTR